MGIGKGKRHIVLSHKDEEIVKAVHFYRYMTALDVAYLLYKASSIRRVRTVLADLCGGGDYVANQYLCRFRMPAIGAGNPERIYSLGARGRNVLVQEFGIPVNWYMSPEKGIHPSFSQMTHDLILTRFLIAAKRFAAVDPDLRLSNTRICYEIGASASVDIAERGRRERVSVVPDGWLLFERVIGDAVDQFPVLVEIDRGTMDRGRIKKHILSRIEFVQSGEYRRMFGVEAVVVAYATTGAKGEFDEGGEGVFALGRWRRLRSQGARIGRECLGLPALGWIRSMRLAFLKKMFGMRRIRKIRLVCLGTRRVWN